ncbi:DUF3566 domain-containing protein [Nocardioides caldifontis]|uniref:DUF3566 domain-containing protein n=1 Tax=Nocardioides caldifontis TaxID=2588938 RepID=UPI0011E01770|nr:DUF3566 domain-containing protein [Nocardioides caldifontis]
MADRRSEDSPAAPPVTGPVGGPAAGAPGGAGGVDPGTPGRDPRGSGAPDPQQELSQRINAAYASSAPIIPDEPDDRADETAEHRPVEEQRPTSAERFAAVLAATNAAQASAQAAGRGEGQAHPAPQPVQAQQPQPAEPYDPRPGKAARRGDRHPGPEAPAAPPGGAPARAEGGSPLPGAPKSGRPPAAPRRVRRARLRLSHIDPWSVMKTAFLLSVALGVVTVVAVAVVWSVLGAAGVWESINSTVADVVGDTGEDFDIEEYLGMSRVMGFTMIIAVVDVVLVTVIATLGAFLYNLAAALLGGLEVVLAEDDR